MELFDGPGVKSEEGVRHAVHIQQRAVFHSEEVAIALAAMGVSVAVEGESLAMGLQFDDQYYDIRDAVAEAGARLRRMGPRHRQLAEILRVDR